MYFHSDSETVKSSFGRVVNMVFGRKAVEESLVKPSPPSVDQILEDLKRADPGDPVFSLNPNTVTDVADEETETDAEKNYKDVLAYVAEEKKITKLQEKIFGDFETLLSSQKEFDKVSAEVAEKLDNLKKERLKISSSKVDLSTKEEAKNLEIEDSDEEDIC